MVNSNKQVLMKRIQQLQFMTVELNLYLDTHPYDIRALMEYNIYTQQLMILKRQYEQYFGPLTNFGYATSEQGWKWISEPWPWENECEGGEKHVGI